MGSYLLDFGAGSAFASEFPLTIADAALAQIQQAKCVAPGDVAPVIVDGKNTVELMTWGFPRPNGGIIIYCKADASTVKPMFAKPLKEGRCIVPASGFVGTKVWRGKEDEEYSISLPERKLMHFAGIKNTFRNAKGQIYQAFVIITMVSTFQVSPLKERMPYILCGEEQMKNWLAHGKLPSSNLILDIQLR